MTIEKEVLNGTVDKIDGDIVHVTFTDFGSPIYAEIPASVVSGIREGRRFTMRSVDGELSMTQVPDVELTREREQEIDAWLDAALGESE